MRARLPWEPASAPPLLARPRFPPPRSIYISAETGAPTSSTVTFGALGDSFYEYLIKAWVQASTRARGARVERHDLVAATPPPSLPLAAQGGRQEPRYRKMYDEAMQGVADVLFKRTSRGGRLAYLADWDGGGTRDKMDHLVW